MKTKTKDKIEAREYVLVHGASHGAWCWEDLIPRLERGGHRVLAVDLPGHGRRAHERHRASIDGYARAVVDAMAQAGVRDAVVVGHSMAGVVIPKVAEMAPARVGHLVFLAAVVLPHGSSIGEAHMLPAARDVALGLARSGGVDAYLYPGDAAWARWYGDLPAGDPRVTAAIARLTPQPLRPWLERIDLTRFYAMDVPRTYIRCLRDVAVPPARGLVYARRLGVEPIDLDCAHAPMLSAVDALTRILEHV